jgi:hypothetical protein
MRCRSFFFYLHHQFNLVWGTVLTCSVLKVCIKIIRWASFVAFFLGSHWLVELIVNHMLLRSMNMKIPVTIIELRAARLQWSYLHFRKLCLWSFYSFSYSHHMLLEILLLFPPTFSLALLLLPTRFTPSCLFYFHFVFRIIKIYILEIKFVNSQLKVS